MKGKLLLLVVVAIGLIGFGVHQKTQAQGNYLDQVYGFSVEVPSGWEVKPAEPGKPGMVTEIYSPDKQVKLSFGILSIDKPSTVSLHDFLASDPSLPSIVTETQTTVNGISSIRLDYLGEGTGTNIFLARGNKVYFISAIPGGAIDKAEITSLLQSFTIVNEYSAVQSVVQRLNQDLTLSTPSSQLQPSQIQSVTDYRLPFVGNYIITQGPLCGDTHVGASREAIDFAMANGTPIYATSSGNASVGWDTTGFGNLVKVTHDNNFVSKYAHLSSFAVSSGKWVNTGELIGYSGNTGNSTGPTGYHLHFEIHDADDQPYSIRTLSGITWYSGDPNNPCQPSGQNDGYATGPTLADNNCGFEVPSGIKLYGDNYCRPAGGFQWPLGPKQYTTPGEYNLLDADNQVSSIRVQPGWSVLVSDDPFFSNPYSQRCVASDMWDLSNNTYVVGGASMNDSVSSIKVYNNSTCAPAVCSFSATSANAPSDCVTPPGPTPTPGGPTPTATPVPPVVGWNVKVFSSADECNSADCNPTTTIYQRTEGGSGINVSFPDGKPWGMGSSTTWGSIWKQTINFPSGSYVFHVDHNDGTRVFINGQNIVDVWGASENNQACPARNLSGNVQIAVIWKNSGGDAHLSFWWDTNTAACSPPTTQWSVRFYSDPNECTDVACNPSTVFKSTNVDGANIGLTFSDGKPWGAGANDVWGSIWHGTINFPTGNYVIHADHDDGLKVFLGGTNIMDVWGSSENNVACPARYLSGNTDMTLIWRNMGGPAHLYFSYSTDQTPCNPTPTPTPPPSAPNVWITRDASTKTHVVLGSTTPLQVRFYTYGSTEQVITPAWTNYQGTGLEFVVPDDWESLLVEGGSVPIIGAEHAPEWHLSAADPHWAVRKFLKLSISSDEFTTITYWHQVLAKPVIHYWNNGVETVTSDLWHEINGGESIEARLPREADGFFVDVWMGLRIEPYAVSSWKASGLNGAIKKSIEVSVEATGTKVTYLYGAPVNVDLGRFNQPVETRSDLWQTDGTNYWFMVPPDVVSFRVTTGPVPEIQPWSGWEWGIDDPYSHWVVKKNIWVYKNSSQKTLVRYMNNVDPSVVPIVYWLDGDPVEHTTTSFWYQIPGGLEFAVPNNVISFLVARGPTAILTDPALPEWLHLATEPHWNVRKFVRVWIDWRGKTYVTYVNETNKPDLEYWLNGVHTVTKSLWYQTSDGKSLEALLPNGIESFKIDAWIVPQLLPSAAGRWEMKNPLDPWITPRLAHKIFLPVIQR